MRNNTQIGYGRSPKLLKGNQKPATIAKTNHFETCDKQITKADPNKQDPSVFKNITFSELRISHVP